jgi:hypothetical protein
MASAKAYDQPSLNASWAAFLEHVPTLLVIWLATLVLSGLGVLVSVLIVLVAAALTGGASDPATSLAALLANLGQLPFVLLSSLVGVLLMAVPALYYETGEVVTTRVAFTALMARPWRYLLAGIFFALVTTVGFLLCIVPGIAVALVAPVYVNRIFLTEQSITQAFAGSFQAVYRSSQGMSYVLIEVLAGLVVFVLSICTCGLGALVAAPLSAFYLQNAAYHKGVIS